MNKYTAFEHKAFVKLFQLFKKKYYSLGSMRGNASLKGFTADEIEEIAGFLGVPEAYLARKGSVDLKQFEEQLATSAFAQVSLVELVEAILKEKLQTKEQALTEKSTAEADFIERLRKVLADCPKWFAQIEKRNIDSRFIWQLQESVLTEMEHVVKAIKMRLGKNEFERLPIFAQRTTGNPHAFDANTLAGKLLVHAAFSLSEEEIAFPRTTEERVDLLATLQIVQDDLWNFVTCQGFHGFLEDKAHPVWQAAVETCSALNMPMRELMKVKRVEPVIGQRVWIVENSSVASTLMDVNPNAPIICTHGQLRMASWRLLDLIMQNEDVVLYYSGDLDPEGLHIAQKIVRRYPGRVELWRMDEASYLLGKSEELLSNERLMKLQRVGILPTVVERMQMDQRASYQEGWLHLLIEDIK
ncbi:MAG: TIGR02679 domain-containing protein [Lysinibacillus sp.]